MIAESTTPTTPTTATVTNADGSVSVAPVAAPVTTGRRKSTLLDLAAFQAANGDDDAETGKDEGKDKEKKDAGDELQVRRYLFAFR